MKAVTRQMYKEVAKRLCETYGVQSVTEPFTVVPALEQRLQDAIVEQSTFLQKVNVITVSQQKGANILCSANGPASGRTDTSGDAERQPKNLLGMNDYGYECVQTESDVYMLYDTMDAWAKFGDLPERYQRYVQERIANDRELIGWYGESAAATTDVSTYPLLQDVNKGWLQYLRDHLPANVLTEGGTVGEIRIGPGGDYVNLDQAVADMVEGIPQYLRKGLVAYVGSELVGREKSLLYQAIGATPTEKNEATESLKSFGGLPYETPSNFPPRGIVITSPENLSIYVQEGTWRRNIKEKPEKNRVEDYNSRNEAYLVETPEAMVAVEFDNVKVPNAAGDAWV